MEVPSYIVKSLINKTNLTSNMSTNSLNQAMNIKLFVVTVCSGSTSSLPSLNYGKFELPMIELDSSSVDQLEPLEVKTSLYI
ncbi:unnamed protein product, partial [Brachionus calyciflorus]